MFYKLLSADKLKDGGRIETSAGVFVLNQGILRQEGRVISSDQQQTKTSFGFKWSQRHSYESSAAKEKERLWLIDRYLGGDIGLLDKYFFTGARVLDAGCGPGVSALSLMGAKLDTVKYFGVDISSAVDLAKENFSEAKKPGEFMQADLTNLPFQGPAFDVIFSEGVLHHTDCTKTSFKYLSRLLAMGGFFLFYVYRKKGPVREFTDDHIRQQLAPMSDQQAWDALRPLTRLGMALGEMKMEIEIPQDIDLLDIKAGNIDLQRFFYWNFCKAYYDKNFDLETMNHINFDWYRPLNCHRHTEEELIQWCAEAGLSVEWMDRQESGFTVAARKTSETAVSGS